MGGAIVVYTEGVGGAIVVYTEGGGWGYYTKYSLQ